MMTSLRSRILLLFAVMWFIITVVLAGIAIHTQVQTTQNSAVQNAISRLALIKNTVEGTIEDIDLVGIRFSNAEKVRALTDASYSARDAEEKRLLPLQVRFLLYEDDYSIQPGHAVTLFLCCGDGRVYSNLTGDFALVQDARSLEIARTISAEPLACGGYSIDVGVLEDEMLAKDTLMYRRRFSSFENRDYVSEIIMLHNRRLFLNRIKYTGAATSSWAVLDAQGKALISDRQAWVGRTADALFGVDSAAFTRQSNSVGCAEAGKLLVYHRNSDSRLIGINILSRSEFVRSARGIILSVVALAVVCLTLFVLLSSYLSKRLTEPLRKLGRKMMQASGGDMDVRFEPRFNDEIGIIGNQFDTMVDQLKISMQQLRETEHEKRKAELRALEMQINPHFLYNTLSSIIWLANEEKNGEVIDITKTLSSYLRLSLSRGREFIPVRDELDHVRTYMSIQNYRYANEVQLLFDVDIAAESVFTPKLMLQPLVENALYHGIKSRETPGGVIRVCAAVSGERLRFEVWDNGTDMTPQRCDELNAALERRAPTGIGTGTVNSRVKLYFGGEYGLSLRRQGDWTIAAVLLPALSEEAYRESFNRG